MKTSLLLEREPFGEILAATLSNYWDNKYGAGHEVHWFQGRPARDRLEGGGAQFWAGNIHLNFFAAAGTPPEHFEVLRREYGRSVQPSRRLLQAAYVWLACNEPMRSRLAQVAFTVRPGVPEAGKTLVLGGNRRLRLLHPDRGTCTVVLKQGFATRYLEKDVNLRSRLAPACAPRLVLAQISQGWYEEEYRPGTPVNRMPAKYAAEIESEAQAQLVAGVISQTLMCEDASSWAERLIGVAAGFVGVLDKVGLSACLEVVLTAARDAISRLVTPGSQLMTSMTHGDFQPANVLATPTGAVIIDWESAERRFVAYDALVYFCQARSSKSLSVRINSILDAGVWPRVDLAGTWPGLESGGAALRHGLLFFLLEELVFQLREQAEPAFLRIDTKMMSVRLNDLTSCFLALSAS